MMNNSDTAESLVWTGERLVTSCNRPLVYEHLHRYAIACELAGGKRVLDIACGEGYGANLLARVAASVVGVDLDAKTIAHAKAKYQHRNLEFIEGSCSAIPCADNSIDLAASFETIEHIGDHPRFIAELKRVLAPGGLLIISSPDKTEYRRRSPAGNPFHEAELTHEEFLRLLRSSFKHCVAGRQRLVVGSWIAPDAATPKVGAATFHGDFNGVDLQPGVDHGIYSIAVCSDKPLPAFNLGMLEDPALSAETWNLLDRPEAPADLLAQIGSGQNAARILQEREQHIALLQGEIEQRSQQVLESRQAFDEKVKHLAILEAELAARTRQLGELQHAFDDKARHVAALEREIDRSGRAFDDKARHVEILQREANEKTRQVDHFRAEAEQHARALDSLKIELQLTTDRLSRVSSELIDVRWEALSTRAAALRAGESGVDQSTAILDLQNRAETAEAEGNHLREMLKAVQLDLEEQQAARDAKDAKLKAVTKELRFQQKQMTRLKEITTRKLILPFGRAQRRIRELTAAKRIDD